MDQLIFGKLNLVYFILNVYSQNLEIKAIFLQGTILTSPITEYNRCL